MSDDFTIRSAYFRPVQTPGITFTQPSLAQQHFKQEADINYIIDRYKTTGTLVDPLKPSTRMPQFGDFTSVPDFHAAQTLISESKAMFSSLPSHIRDRFKNDPGQLLAFLADENNREEAIKLGIIPAPASPAPSVEQSPPAAPSPAPAPDSTSISESKS